ncbi:MAG: hypothetical protein QF715_01220 [Pseudomonadales bacterium]|nr:hypothetical protein [Pseudomonadales bacterium]MDP6314644.1 hypothetical protein [Pseudomonadales bacterium]MDP7313375.1 hypothetical protein [Pseudomonadales bacterium]
MVPSELMVFDYLSSAFDVNTERTLRRQLDQVENSTCLVVSDRQSMLQSADQIIVLKNGSLETIGSLDELLSSNDEMKYLFGLESTEDWHVFSSSLFSRAKQRTSL